MYQARSFAENQARAIQSDPGFRFGSAQDPRMALQAGYGMEAFGLAPNAKYLNPQIDPYAALSLEAMQISKCVSTYVNSVVRHNTLDVVVVKFSTTWQPYNCRERYPGQHNKCFLLLDVCDSLP